MKFKISQDCDYVMGHLRYGHLECTVDAESIEDVRMMLADGDVEMELVIDDYSVDDYEKGENPIEIFEVK